MTRASLLIATLVLPFWPLTSAEAQPHLGRPCSVLIFPLCDSTAGNLTLVTVTNTDDNETPCPGGFRQGDVEAHYLYYSEFWQLADQDEPLSPADTITVLTRAHNRAFDSGFLIVEVRDPATGLEIDHDVLIGSALIINSEFDYQWTYMPYGFEGLIEAGAVDACGRFLVDPPGDPDENTIDFNGVELSYFPDQLLLDRFFGEGSPAGRPGLSFGNTIYLMSSSSGRPGNSTNVSLMGWNNNELAFTRMFSFDCYLLANLGSIINAVTQPNLSTGGDTSELFGVATGWLRLTATNADHALLGVFSESSSIGPRSFTTGKALHYAGTRQISIDRVF